MASTLVISQSFDPVEEQVSQTPGSAPTKAKAIPSEVISCQVMLPSVVVQSVDVQKEGWLAPVELAPGVVLM